MSIRLLKPLAPLLAIAVCVLSLRRAPVRAAEAPVTFSRQIAPLIYANCATCHHAGGAGPFSLMTYQELRRHAPEVMAVTQSRYMPPWLPEPGYGDFSESRRLSDHDRALLRTWIQAGMPPGDLSEAPPPPIYTGAWQLGAPDLVLTVEQPYLTPAAGTDVFRNFILPYPLGETRYIRAMEILPGTPAAVHHANLLLDRGGSFRRQHPSDWKAGIPGMELMVDAGSSFDPDSHFLFWKPDSPAIKEPQGMEWRLDEGDDLILNMHLKPTGKPETIQAQVGLYFSKTPPVKSPMLLQLENDAALDIPAGANQFVISDELKMPLAVKVLGVYPHAHYLGKEMQAYAILPDGRKRWLVWIRDWDIDRQAVYRYREPLLLPKGTVVHMRYVYDNSTGNPRNPHAPAVRVKAGNRSEDEMGHLWLQVLPVEPRVAGKDARLVLEQAWMASRLRKSPDDPISLYNLAAASAEEGKNAEAVALYRRILVRSPNDARTLTALGAALEGAGDWHAAAETWQRALRANSAQNDARFDLARIHLAHGQAVEAERELHDLVARTPRDAAALAMLGELEIKGERLSEAIGHLQQAVSVSPDDADVRESLAFAYAQSGRLEDAAVQLRELVRLRPDDPAGHAQLSQTEGSLGLFPAAIAEEERALKLTPADADGWNNLGVLHARIGATTKARKDFERALQFDPSHAQARANLDRLPPE